MDVLLPVLFECRLLVIKSPMDGLVRFIRLSVNPSFRIAFGSLANLFNTLAFQIQSPIVGNSSMTEKYLSKVWSPKAERTYSGRTLSMVANCILTCFIFANRDIGFSVVVPLCRMSGRSGVVQCNEGSLVEVCIPDCPGVDDGLRVFVIAVFVTPYRERGVFGSISRYKTVGVSLGICPGNNGFLAVDVKPRSILICDGRGMLSELNIEDPVLTGHLKVVVYVKGMNDIFLGELVGNFVAGPLKLL